MLAVTIHASPGDWWYVCFKDQKGVDHYIPTTKRWFWRKWIPENCPPIVYTGRHKENVLRRFDDPSQDESWTPDDLRNWFFENNTSVEKYLEQLNLT